MFWVLIKIELVLKDLPISFLINDTFCQGFKWLSVSYSKLGRVSNVQYFYFIVATLSDTWSIWKHQNKTSFRRNDILLFFWTPTQTQYLTCHLYYCQFICKNVKLIQFTKTRCHVHDMEKVYNLNLKEGLWICNNFIFIFHLPLSAVVRWWWGLVISQWIKCNFWYIDISIS